MKQNFACLFHCLNDNNDNNMNSNDLGIIHKDMTKRLKVEEGLRLSGPQLRSALTERRLLGNRGVLLSLELKSRLQSRIVTKNEKKVK